MQKAKCEDIRTSNGVLFYACFEVDRHYSKKNEKTLGYRWGKGAGSARRKVPFIMSTQAARTAGDRISMSLREYGVPGIHTKLPIDGMAMSLMLCVESDWLTQKGKINQRAGDLDNISTSYIDLLMKVGVIKDDSMITSIKTRKLHSDRNKITIWLTEDKDFIYELPQK